MLPIPIRNEKLIASRDNRRRSIMDFSLEETQRKECSIEELGRIIFRFRERRNRQRYEKKY